MLSMFLSNCIVKRIVHYSILFIVLRDVFEINTLKRNNYIYFSSTDSIFFLLTNRYTNKMRITKNRRIKVKGKKIKKKIDIGKKKRRKSKRKKISIFDFFWH